VCRHRWAPVCDGNGNATVFVCPYHAWTYNLDGSLRGAAAMEHTPCFKKEERGLFKIRHEVWQGFVFINLDGRAEPLAKQLAPAVGELKEFGLSDWKLVRTRDLGECPWDWKVFMDNGECYHHLGAHRTTFEADYPAANSWDSPNNGNYTLTWCRAKNGEELIARTMKTGDIVPGLTDTQRLNMCLLYVFPNYFICPNPSMMMSMRVFPLGPGRIRVFADYSVPPHIKAGPELEARLDSYEEFVELFNGEDSAVCTLAQRGLQSRLATSAPLSRLEGHNRDFALWVSRKLTC
jgi:phenylpropionate dioxygenase-like ring-hydroxylating dioxygenase large terminal subunit